jgi:hypothetical protein
VKGRRSTMLGFNVISRDDEGTRNTESWMRLLCLKRTLKDKEQMVAIYDELLKKPNVTSSDINEFRMHHPEINGTTEHEHMPLNARESHV